MIDRPVRPAGSSFRGRVSYLVVIVAALVIGFQIVTLFAKNPEMQWGVIGKYIFAPVILVGVVATLLVTVGAWAIGLLGGLALALMRSSANEIVKLVAFGYISLFRSVPLLVQILFWYNLATFIPRIFIGIPFSSLGVDLSTNAVLTPAAACLIALGLNQAAYLGEIIRGGLLGVPAGQVEAARSLGMTRLKTFSRVVAPQAFRLVLPSMGNDLISLMKATSLVSVVGFGDLMTRAQSIYSVNYQVIPLLVVASLWYMVLTTFMVAGVSVLESRFSHGFRAPEKAGLPRRMVLG
jgi:polar amino acid transport system permease protein